MIGSLAVRSLRRHRARTALALAGIAISSAMLLDMVMMSSGMRVSFQRLLEARGFQLRLSPRGTLPFDGEATLGGAQALVAALAREPDVIAVAPVLGGTVHHPRGDGAQTAFGLGIDPGVQGDYTLVAGRDAQGPLEVVMNRAFLATTGVRLGDTVSLAAAYDPQLRSFSGLRTVTVTGEARFTYLAAGQAAVAFPLATLQAMRGADGADRLSLVMLRLRDGADPDSVGARIERAQPRVTALSTRKAVQQAEERLGYFRQLALVLGSISLVVGFLLVTTIVTVSVNERLGEIAVLRAIGVGAGRVASQVMLEGLVLATAGATLGLGLGLVTAQWLNAILSGFPSLPEHIAFFVFEPGDAFASLGLLVVTGFVAGALPAWRAARLPIARTLRTEAIA
ncbi:MAG: ABC transporter permease [Gemmatimonadetes bacterium]|nr:ABC transporter permease [Gemmatimonadota bacterium]